MVIFISIYIVKVGTGKLLLLHGDLYLYLHCQSGQVSCYYYMVIFISIYIVKVGTGKLSVLHGDLYFYLHCKSRDR